MKKLSFLLSLVLMLSLVSPAWASANLAAWDKYEYKYGQGVSKPLYTTNDALLIEDMEIQYNSLLNSDFGAVYGQVYNYDLVRIDQNKKIEKISLQNGLNRFVEHNGKSYSLFYDYETHTLNVYDEQFNLLKTIPFTKHLNKIVSFNQYNNYISYVTYEMNTSYDFTPPQVTVIDLNTFNIVENVKTPAATVYTYYTDQGGTNLVVYDQLGNIIKDFASSSELGSIYESHVENDTIYGISEIAGANYFIKATIDGQVLQKEKLNNDSYYAPTVAGDSIFFVTYDFDTNTYFMISYNMKTGKLDQSLRKNVSIYPVSDDTFIETTYNENTNSVTAAVKNSAGETTATFQDNGYWREISESYILSVHETETGRQFKIIELKTGTVTAEINESADEYSQFAFINNNKLYKTEYVYEGAPTYQEKFSGTLYIINPKETEKPNLNAFPANKAWTISFTTDVDASTVNSSNIYVTDANGNKLTQEFKVEGKKVMINAPANGYTSGKYVLHVENGIHSAAGKALKAGQTKAFEIQ